jgi:NAD(P)-dependent dehydrogenase (short-subunit alcohol dehydrogenase family)
MTATTHADYGKETEAFTVAAAFPDSIKGRTIIITGANKQGIGYATAEAFASQGPAHLILAGRTPSKVDECIDALRTKYPNIDYRALRIDLGSQKSVRAAAAEVIGWADVPTVDLLVNNAGIMNIPERTFNEDNIEITIATNHVGHFLFTNLILPKLIAAAKNAPKGSVRVVNLSSSGVRASAVRFDDLRWEKPASQVPEQQRPNWELLKAFGLKFDEEAGYNPVAAYGESSSFFPSLESWYLHLHTTLEHTIDCFMKTLAQ